MTEPAMAEVAGAAWLASKVGKALWKHGTEFAFASMASHLKRNKDEKEVRAKLAKATDDAMRFHQNYAARWSEKYKPAGSPSTLLVDDATVPLDYTATPRRYAPLRAPEREFDELDLLFLGHPLLLTGDPGAGKTTTIQRLCRHLLTEPASGPDEPQYPVVVECRGHDWSKKSLVDVLCEATGFPETDGDRLAAVAEFLDMTGAYVFVDGLDEVGYGRGGRTARERLENDVRSVAHHLRHGRIIVSCRSGSAPELPAYDSLELCPLSPEQVEEVVRSRLGDGTQAFLDELAASPIRDVAHRPLLLGQLVTVFRLRGGQMPSRPAVLYDKIVTLLLEQWDEQRALKRRSVYARFEAAEKKRFLAELSYRLTLNGSIEFSSLDLVDVYEDICVRHDLPANQAKQVAREIESHTGLVVHSSDMYAFSHLSLQEYLCADYLSRAGLEAELLGDYIDRYPEPVAVAIAISSNPNSWMWQVVWKRQAFQKRDSVRAFVRRLGQERPPFTAGTDLGHSVIRLMFGADDTEAFASLAAIPAVRESVAEAVEQYARGKGPGGGVSLKYEGPKEAGRKYTPRQGSASMELWNLMLPGLAPYPAEAG